MLIDADGGWGKGERQTDFDIGMKEAHQLVAFCTGPHQGLNPQPFPFGKQDDRCSNQLSHTPARVPVRSSRSSQALTHRSV